jgi:VanZ family protein
MTTSGRRRVAVVGLTVAIVVLGVAPIGGVAAVVGPPNPVTTTGHFVAYAALGFVLPLAISGWRAHRRILVVAFVLGVALGAGVEVLQWPIPYRDASLLDLAVDAAGAAVGIAAFSVVARGKRSRSRPG